MTPERSKELLDLTEENGAFSKAVPGLQLIWDSTSLGALKTCPRKYYYEIICGWRSKKESVHLTFGIYVHSILEKYDHLRLEMDYEQALLATLRYALEISGERVEEAYCPNCGGSVESSECPGCGTATELREVWKPWLSDDSNKNRFTLIRSIVWYIEHYKDDPVQTITLANGKPAVELSFKLDLPAVAPSGETYALSGHMDKVGAVNDGEYILDRKTSKNTLSESYFAGYSPDNQMTTYTTAGKVIFQRPVRGVMIDAMQVAVTFTRFSRGFAPRTDDQLEEWLADTITYFRQAESYAEAGHWPMNDKSCSMFGGCPFRDICSRSPKVRDQWLKGDFVRRIWDPTVSRGL